MTELVNVSMLTIPTRINYSVRLLWELEQHRRQHHAPSTSVPVLAEKLKLPQPYLAQLARKLARAGILESFAGVHGGYRLPRPISRITLGDVVAAVEPRRPLVRCLRQDTRRCPCASGCGAPDWWRKLERKIAKVLAATPLSPSL